MRTEVSRDRPTGKGWRTIQTDTRFVQVSCFNGMAWFLDRTNNIHVYKGIVYCKRHLLLLLLLLPLFLRSMTKFPSFGIAGVEYLTPLSATFFSINHYHCVISSNGDDVRPSQAIITTDNPLYNKSGQDVSGDGWRV